MNYPERRKGYRELQLQLESHTAEIESRFRRWFIISLLSFALIGLSSTAALIGFTALIEDIKETRRDFVVNTCLAQNERHDHATSEFKEAVEEAIQRNPEREAMIRANEKANLDIINALVPKQDCVELGKVAIGESDPPPPEPSPNQQKEDP